MPKNKQSLLKFKMSETIKTKQFVETALAKSIATPYTKIQTIAQSVSKKGLGYRLVKTKQRRLS